MSSPEDVLEFWLDQVGPERWYKSDEALDASMRGRFLELWQAADAGGLEHWVEGSPATLAYVILCDQFPRNMFRGEARAFATDARARAAARRAVAEGWDLAVPEPDRQFFYMPFEHSEAAADQAEGVDLITQRMAAHPDLALHARAHAEIIARFGRFPFRNAALGRATTPAEAAFLAEGGYGAIVRALKG